ncbi:Histone-lysine N-methyltransferase SETMAR [Eumeta japonica]|uniref:Histone-lysine N-methyltransferase SETMAR n=1 Tax=Eumeta variegata TaxID=151549 RepID=A0A4C1VS48_EUMVA|nr:Histone-lysine N-methyltransferase SETMAR [Eumeta japonica]
MVAADDEFKYHVGAPCRRRACAGFESDLDIVFVGGEIPPVEVFEEIKKNNRKRRINFHHDNASCRTSAETTQFLKGQKIESLPPYSSDLAPNDFYLFPSVKNKLRGQRFASREEALDAFKMHVLETPQSEWKKCCKIGFSPSIVSATAPINLTNPLADVTARPAWPGRRARRNAPQRTAHLGIGSGDAALHAVKLV